MQKSVFVEKKSLLHQFNFPQLLFPGSIVEWTPLLSRQVTVLSVVELSWWNSVMAVSCC